MRSKASYRLSPRIQALLLLGLVVVAGWYARAWLEANRPQDVPWAPLAIAHPVGLATGLKLARLSGDKAECLALFEGSALKVAAIDDFAETPQCGIADAVRLQRMSAAYAPADVKLACPLAAAIAIWEEQVVQPAAIRHFGSPVACIEHFGTYSCRRMYGREEGRWSKHASGEAIDIAAFRLADGRRVSVLADWAEDGFLADIRDGGCGIFGTVLGPQYNAAHADHFHLEQTGYGTCR